MQTFEMSVMEQSFYATHCPREQVIRVREDLWVYVCHNGVIYAANLTIAPFRKAVETN